MHKDEQRLKDWLEKHGLNGSDCVAIFDVGTRACRVIVAPQRVPDRWEKSTFWNDGRVFEVGFDVDEKGVLDPRSSNLSKMLEFMRTRHSWLRKYGFKDIVVIATAWFRWLYNHDEIATLILDKTGLVVEEIPQSQEAQLTIASLPFIEQRSTRKLRINEGDRVFMLDQGGGSLEISWMDWQATQTRPILGTLPIERFGTVKLKRDFYRHNADGEPVEPENNHAGISAQIRRIQGNARREFIENWSGRNALLRRQQKIHLIATGTISKATSRLQGMGQFETHGYRITLQDIETRLEELGKKYDGISVQVLSLYKKVMGLEGSGVKKIPFSLEEVRLDLDLICGLPVYAEAMKALGVTELKILGYPLRHGRYVWQYGQGMPLSPVQPNDTGPFVFVSYSHEDRQLLESELSVLNSLGIRLWWDTALIGGKPFRKKLPDQVRRCSALIFLMTRNSVESIECQKEIVEALKHSRPIIPLEQKKTALGPVLQVLIEDINRIQRFSMGEGAYLDAIERAVPPAVIVNKRRK